MCVTLQIIFYRILKLNIMTTTVVKGFIKPYEAKSEYDSEAPVSHLVLVQMYHWPLFSIYFRVTVIK